MVKVLPTPVPDKLRAEYTSGDLVHRAELSLRFGSESLATTVWRALAPERGVGPRGVRLDLLLSGDRVDVVVEASDESALRATLNSIVKLVYLVLEVLGTGVAR